MPEPFIGPYAELSLKSGRGFLAEPLPRTRVGFLAEPLPIACRSRERRAGLLPTNCLFFIGHLQHIGTLGTFDTRFGPCYLASRIWQHRQQVVPPGVV